MLLRTKDLDVVVRPGTIDDVPLLLDFIRSMAAYATYFFTFATMVGREACGSTTCSSIQTFAATVGEALMAYLADVALRNQCARFEWMVLDWNESAIGFYQRLGASLLADWRVCRLDEAALSRVAGKLVAADGQFHDTLLMGRPIDGEPR